MAMVAQIAQCKICRRIFPDWYGPDMLYANDNFIDEITQHVLKHEYNRAITIEDAYRNFVFYGKKFKVEKVDPNEQLLPKQSKNLQ